ncbi:hypothetical protein ABW20_dc0108024 [Dactylellina cionopaga]|nr:hypothetical protein ABW20_dc0108024 [Dactylellina cionopaga]
MASSQTFPATQTPDTALALVLPQSHSDIVQPFRSLYDAAAIKWPPHINLFYPFVHSSSLEAASEYLTQQLPSICKTPLSIRFSQVEVFRGGKKRPSFLVLRPDEASEKLIQDIYELLSHEFPEVRKAVKRQDFKPHMTIGQVQGGNEGRISNLSKKFRVLCKQIGAVEMGLATMRRTDGQMRFIGSWGVQEYPVSLSPECVPGSIVKRHAFTYRPPYIDGGGDEDEDGDDDESRWEVAKIDEEAVKSPGRGFTLSTYNVFIDLDDFESQGDRWWKICKKLIAASSTVVCLQEVSDDLLAMIGNSWEVRRKYPYLSHSPEQPLLRLRNCVILSSVPFTWEEVSSAVQGRSICAAKFDQFGYYTVSPTEAVGEAEDGNQSSEKTWHPLILCNVHLPAYMTDEAIKAKSDYAKEIKSHVDNVYPTNPVLIVGDTNISNESTIEHAVTHKLITESSAAEYAKLFSTAEYSDAWLIAGEGLDGSTFDPINNVLAHESSHSGSDVPRQPQRYDRIYLRNQGGENLLIREVRVSLDGDEDMPASDHYLLNARLSFIDNEKTASAATAMLELPTTPLKDDDLRTLLIENNSFPSQTEIQVRHRAIQSLEACLKGFDSLSPSTTESTFQLRLVPVGSFGLGTYDPTSDIDCLVVGNISTSLFWRVTKQRIKKWRGKAADDSSTAANDALSVKIVRYVNANIPMLILLVGDKVRIDLQYCTAVRIVEEWDSIPSAPINSPLFNLTVATLKKLQAYRDMLFILNNVPNLATFRLAYRLLKLWATKRGVYSSKFGFLGGVHVTLLLARVAILLPARASASQLIVAFFKEYAAWDWTKDMVTMPNTGRIVRYQRATRDRMVVLTITTPAVNVASNATLHTVRTLSAELEQAAAKLDVNASFAEIAGAFGDSGKNISSAVGEFLEGGFNRYVKVDVQFWGTNRQGGRALVGWVESRIVGLLTELQRQTPGLTARVWPGRFHEVPVKSGEEEGKKNVEEDEKTEMRGFYLLGLAPVPGSTAEMSKEEKRNGEAAFAAVLRNFETAVRNKDKFDEKDSWVTVSCVKHDGMVTEAGHVVEEDKTMVWDGGEADEEGDSIPDDEDSEDEEENEMVETLLGEGGNDDDFFGSTAKKNKKKNAVAVQQKTGPTPKLRPSIEVFNRIKWDNKYDAASYVIGYEDRFRGVLEIGVDKWKTEMSDEEFVPMHRVVYFRDRKTGEVVWDREKRVDRIFGSGRVEEGKKGKKN